MSELLHTLNIDPKVIAAQVAGFVLLWLVLSKYLFAPVLSLLRSREEEIRATYERAGAEHDAAVKLKADLEQRIAGIEAEARTKVQAAVKEGQAAREEILAEARKRAEEIRRHGEEELARERDKLLAELRERVVNVSLSAAGSIIGETLDEERHRKLIGEFIDKLEVAG